MMIPPTNSTDVDRTTSIVEDAAIVGSTFDVTLWNIFKRIGASLSADEQRKVFRETAEHAYWL